MVGFWRTEVSLAFETPKKDTFRSNVTLRCVTDLNKNVLDALLYRRK